MFVILGRYVISFLEEVGGITVLAARAFKRASEIFRNLPSLFFQMERIGIGSIPLVLVTSLFVGAVTAVQAAYQFQGPVLTALVVGGRVSAAMAAELGTMKVTEQIDAIKMIAIDPIDFLVIPRITAAVIMLPVLTVFSNLLAILGGMLVSDLTVGVTPHVFIEGLKLLFRYQDVVGGLLKSLFFGYIIALMGCYYGFNTEGGAEGVGMATMKAVVSSCLLILVSNYLLANIIFRIIFAP